MNPTTSQASTTTTTTTVENTQYHMGKEPKMKNKEPANVDSAKSQTKGKNHKKSTHLKEHYNLSEDFKVTGQQIATTSTTLNQANLATTINVAAPKTVGPYGNYSTMELQQKLHQTEENMDRLMNQRIVREEIKDNGRKALVDIKTILQDLQIFLVIKNSDEKLQRLITETISLYRDFHEDPDIRGLLMHWKALLYGLGGKSLGASFLDSSKKLARELRDTECLMKLIVEGEKTLEFTLSKDPLKDKEKEAIQKERVFQEFMKVLQILARNESWQQIVFQGKIIQSTVSSQHKTGYETEVGHKKKTEVQGNPHYVKMLGEFKVILACLMKDAKEANPDLWVAYLKETWQDIQSHPGYREYIQSVKAILVQVVEDPSTLDDPNVRSKLRDLYNRGWTILEQVKGHGSLIRARDEGRRMWNQIKADECNAKIINDTQTLLKDLRPPPSFDEKTQQTTQGFFDLSLLPQLQRIIIPFLLESFREIPIPPIDGVTDNRKLRFHLENMVLSSLEILPENIYIEASYKTNADPYKLKTFGTDTVLHIEATNIQARLKGTQWSYARLKFPKITDQGEANIFVGGSGTRVGIKVRIHKNKDPNKNIVTTQVIDSYCFIDNIDLTLYNCKHKFMYKFWSKLLKKNVAMAIEKEVSNRLASMVNLLETKIQEKLVIAKQKQTNLSTKIAEIKEKTKNKSKSGVLNETVITNQNTNPAPITTTPTPNINPNTNTTTTTSTSTTTKSTTTFVPLKGPAPPISAGLPPVIQPQM